MENTQLLENLAILKKYASEQYQDDVLDSILVKIAKKKGSPRVFNATELSQMHQEIENEIREVIKAKNKIQNSKKLTDKQKAERIAKLDKHLHALNARGTTIQSKMGVTAQQASTDIVPSRVSQAKGLNKPEVIDAEWEEIKNSNNIQKIKQYLKRMSIEGKNLFNSAKDKTGRMSAAIRERLAKSMQGDAVEQINNSVKSQAKEPAPKPQAKAILSQEAQEAVEQPKLLLEDRSPVGNRHPSAKAKPRRTLRSQLEESLRNNRINQSRVEDLESQVRNWKNMAYEAQAKAKELNAAKAPAASGLIDNVAKAVPSAIPAQGIAAANTNEALMKQIKSLSRKNKVLKTVLGGGALLGAGGALGYTAAQDAAARERRLLPYANYLY